ncbi:MAG: 4-(cytidine 5'-diphospho)-2-C-methyl-D-erythritol kinase [Candidatus Margulisiibacteriota bacterium]
MKLASFAKLNLSLLVFAPNARGYHPICSVFQTISLADTLDIEKTTAPGFQLRTTPSIPDGGQNILEKIYSHFADSIPFGISASLSKVIPFGAGLGGGSSNAAAFLRYLNQEAGWSLSLEALKKRALPFGADIPFFIEGGTALVRGIGEKMRPLEAGPWKAFVLICPPIHCNTAAVYKAFDATPAATKKPGPTPKALLTTHLGPNDLKEPVFALDPRFGAIENTLLEAGLGQVLMSGSGSTLFVPFQSPAAAAQALPKIADVLAPHQVQVHLVETVGVGSLEIA